MPDYAKLHDMISHRIELEYDTGARITGYLAACQPTSGKVEFAVLKKAELVDSSGNVAAKFDELIVCPNVLSGVRFNEGPRGRDVRA